MFFKKSYTPGPCDYNRNGKLSYEAILEMTETVASEHTAALGESLASTLSKGVSWILLQWQVKILRRPEMGENLNIASWVRGKSGSKIVFCNYVFSDTDGNELIHVESRMALYDFSLASLISVSDTLLDLYQPEDRVLFADSSRLSEPQTSDTECELLLRRSDIDFNHHVHNTKYVQLLIQALPETVFERDDMSEFIIAYINPIKENDSLTAKYTCNDDVHSVTLYNQKGLCTLSEFRQ